MRALLAIAGLVLTAASFAQEASQPCPSDKPVDDIITEIHKSQSKKNSRNKNPLPDAICIFGWCPITVKKPASTPPPATDTRQETPQQADSSSSSSRSAVDKCNSQMEIVLDAAHNVEVGDYYFGEKNYRAALLRYKDALDAKPDDNAIAVRLGRVSEKLNDIPAAIEYYTSATKLAGPEKWTEEARTALARLKDSPPRR